VSPAARRRLVAALMILGSVVVALAIGEVACSFVVPRSTYPDLFQDSPDPLLGYELRPGADVDFDGITIKIPSTRVRVSSRGFRQDGGALDPNKRHLLCLGDSVTFGWGVEESEAFCARIGRSLGDGWEHVNLGVPGYNTAQELRLFERRGLALRPELVLLQIDPNDVMGPDRQATSDSLWAWLVDHSALARFIHIRLRAADGPNQDGGGEQDDGGEQDGSAAGPAPDPSAVPTSAVPTSGIEGIVGGVERLHALSTQYGFQVVVLVTLGQDDAPLAATLKRLSLPWVDLRAALRGPPGALEIPGDGHPNAEGHKKIAEATLRQLPRPPP
jgi:lysophospholipase L1-like esterase